MQKIIEKLAAIQAELHAPKSQYNEFGKYKYRKAEDILEAVKPLNKEHGCALTCTDELVLIGDRYYIKATATLTAVEDGSSVSATAWAREEIDKKGMDQSQVTGASSSYARKYALNGLYSIDDTPDSDTTNTGDGKPVKKADKPAPKAEQKVAPASKPAPRKEEKAEAPARGSEEWKKWVEAIATNAPSKSGQKVDWVAAFKKHYKTDPDMIGCLEEDAFNYRMETGTAGPSRA
jgi:hypothetical protein